MFIAIARLIRLVALALAAIIVAAIVLSLLSANPTNSIVKDVHDAGGALAGPFKNPFSIKDAKLAMTVNWGIAALVYVVVGGSLASLIARMGAGRLRSVGPAV